MFFLFVLLSFALSATPDIDNPLKTGATARYDAALVISIEDYAFIPDVPYAKRDGEAFYNFLVYTRGIPSDRVKLLTGPNREQILREAEALSKEVGNQGTFWVYFAGHGAASTTTGERILLGVDVMNDPQVFQDRAVDLSALRNSAKDAGKIMLVLDTCYAGVGRSGSELIAGPRFAVPAYASASASTVAEWNAASANQLSGPLEPAEHGAFTYFVVGAMRGWADGEVTGQADGVVTLNEAELYVSRALRTAVDRTQEPELVAQSAGDWVLSSGRLENGPELSAMTFSSKPSVTPIAPTKPAPAGCAFVGNLSVSATMTTVTINGRTQEVRGAGPKAAFIEQLEQCNYQNTVRAFRAWRGARVATNVIGPLTYGMGAIFPALAAGACRATFERRLVKKK